jgi:hypothetical protein
MRLRRCDSSGRSSTSAMVDGRVVPGDATLCVLRRRRRVCVARHEFRGAPHNGFAVAISRTSPRMSRAIGGRPFALGAERWVHRRRSQSRCQPTTVSGRTSTTAVRQFLQIRRRPIQNSRPRVCSWGRLVARFIAISCCRSARFSRTSSRCPRSPSASARPATISSSSMSRSSLA